MTRNHPKKIKHTLGISFALSLGILLASCGGGGDKAPVNTQIDSGETIPPVSTETDSGETLPPVEGWTLVWADEFDGASIDKTKWNHEVNCDGGGNNEQQCYTDNADNSFIADGNLNIVALPAEAGAQLPYTSARMTTQYNADFTYGRFEMRAKLPHGQGSWPAFWMMPTDSIYGGWPRSGEIDIMEAVNLKVTDSNGDEEARVHGTLHYGQAWPNNDRSGKETLLPDGTNPADEFHTYAVEWQEGEIRWYVDEYLFQTQLASEIQYSDAGDVEGLIHKGWYSEYLDPDTGEFETHWDTSPYDQKFFMILNFAVGGDWPSNVNNTGIDGSVFEDGQAFQIDYVRVYECSTDPVTGAGCETTREGYKDLDDALVEGKAPNPPTEFVPGSSIPITIFADGENPQWPLWDCCAGTVPTIETDDAEHGAVAEFQIHDNVGTVLGFNSREAGAPYDASGMLTTGSLSFDLKIVTPPTESAASWYVKVESNNADEAWDTIIEPVIGEWKSFSISIQELADAGLDVRAIDVIMIFPTWGSAEGAVYRVDNMEISD